MDLISIITLAADDAAQQDGPSIIDTLAQFDAIIGILFTWAIAGIVFLRARTNYRKKHFKQYLNFSLNDVQNNGLILRTLCEAKAGDIFISSAAVGSVMRAIEKTTEDMPFFALDDDDDWAFIQRCVLNELSEKTTDVFVARAIGLPVATGNFVFGITYEKYGDMRTRKIRVILIEAGLLKRYFGPNAADQALAQLTVQEATHKARIATLKTMGRLYFSGKPADKRYFREVELGVALPAKI